MNNQMVSIIMPAYNAEKWIRRSIETCLAQTYQKIELILIDDGSSDKTLKIMQEFAAIDNRVRIICHEKNRGEWAARNTGLDMACGEYIGWQDADDWSQPERIEKQIERLNSLPICDCVTTGTVWVEGPGQAFDRGGRNGMIPEIYLAGQPGAYPHNASIVVRREIYDYVGKFEHIDPYGCDSIWDVRAIMAGIRWSHINEPLYYYRRHSESMLHNPVKKMAAIQAVKKIRDIEYEKWKYPYFIHRNFDVLTNGSCSLDCPACNQIPFRCDYQDYQMSMIEMEKLCRRVIEISAGYKCLGFSGGEPLLWKNLEVACRLAKDSGAFKKIRLYSNCSDLERMMKVLDGGLVDYVYSSVSNVVPRNIGPIIAQHPDKIHLGEAKYHKWAPNQPILNSLPAKCTCDRNTLIENTVYPCGAFYSQTKRLGRRLEEYNHLYCSLDDDWKAFFRGVDMYNMDLCQYCLNNENVWPKLRPSDFPHWPDSLPIPQIPAIKATEKKRPIIKTVQRQQFLSIARSIRPSKSIRLFGVKKI